MQKKFSFKNLFSNVYFIATVYFLVVLIATIIKVKIGSFNNFLIYRNSFYHLINHQTLYGFFPNDSTYGFLDEFLYGPAFAVFIAPFALLPAPVGAVVWTLFNAFSVFFGVKLLQLHDAKKVFIWWFILIELITAIQNVQINPLMGALFLFIFYAFENKKVGLAAFLIAFGTFIKVFGILGAALFLLYPQKGKFIAYGILWSIVLLVCPLAFVSVNELIILYQSWFNTLVGDHAINHDISVMRLLANIFKPTDYGFYISIIQVLAIAVFCVKYIRYKQFESNYFKQLFLASIMIWSVIFSHAAESSTYIIPVIGVAIWYVNEEKSKWNLALICVVFVLTSLSPTDVIPRNIRIDYLMPMALKALPCFMVWIIVECKLLTTKKIN